MKLLVHFFVGLIIGVVVFSFLLRTTQTTIGAFFEPFISIQLSSSTPSNGYILSTNGTDNIWIANTGGGGGGSGVGWASTTGDRILYNTLGNAVVLSPGDQSATTTNAYLNVFGGVSADYFFASSTATSTFPYIAATNTVISNRLGVGTSTPDNPVVILLPAVGSNSYFSIHNTGSTFRTRLGTTALNQSAWFTNLYWTGAAWTRDDATKGGWRMNQVVGNATDALNSVNFDYMTIAGAAPASRFTITGSGLVGIGTTSPLYALTVAGDARISGAFYDRLSTAGTAGSVLKTTGSQTEWIATSTLGIDFSDVRGILAISQGGTGLTSSGASGTVLVSDGTSWTARATSTLGISGGAGATALSALTDVNVTGVASGSVLVYNGSTWLDQATSSLGINLDDVRGILPIAKGGTGLSSVGASGTIPFSTGSALQYLATSTLGVSWNNLRDVPSGFADGTDDGAGGGSLSTTTDNNEQPSEVISYITDDFYIGGSASTTAEFNFDKDATRFIISSTTATASGSVMSNSGILHLGKTLDQYIALIFNTAGDIIMRGFAGITRFVIDMSVRITGNLDVVGTATTTDLALNGRQHQDTSPSSDHSANGVQTNDILAGDSITAIDLVFLASNGRWRLTDADDVASSSGMLGIALETQTAGTALNVALPGSFVRDDSWSFASGTVLYVATTTAGGITISEPSATDDISRVIGWAVNPTTIFFNPSGEFLVIQ